VADTLLLAAAFFAVAALYGSVGHAGASGYLAVMALVGVAPERMKPTALVLNILVATLATLNFRRAGVFYPRAVFPFAVGSVPMAFLGGSLPATHAAFKPALAFVLAAAAARLFLPAGISRKEGPEEPRVGWGTGIALGAGIGLLAGLTGTGGGIFLSPLLVFAGWATVRQSAGVSALFILVNSISGLAANASKLPAASVDLALLAGAAGVGGFVGSRLGASRIPSRPLGIVLGVVLVIAAGKLAFT
jgi:uncharacterized membrane protein YfcA